MAYCGPRGIPVASFLDEWDQFSRGMALAWMARENDRCGSCGQHRHDWLDDDGIELRDRPAKAVPVYCPPCDDLARARKAHGDLAPGVSLGWEAIAPSPASGDSLPGDSTVTG